MQLLTFRPLTFFRSFLADFSNAVCSPPGTPKRSDSVGVIYWQVRLAMILHLLVHFT